MIVDLDEIWNSLWMHFIYRVGGQCLIVYTTARVRMMMCPFERLPSLRLYSTITAASIGGRSIATININGVAVST